MVQHRFCLFAPCGYSHPRPPCGGYINDDRVLFVGAVFAIKSERGDWHLLVYGSAAGGLRRTFTTCFELASILFTPQASLCGYTGTGGHPRPACDYSHPLIIVTPGPLVGVHQQRMILRLAGLFLQTKSAFLFRTQKYTFSCERLSGVGGETRLGSN